MRSIRSALLVGVAAVAVAASAGFALAKNPTVHDLTVRLPDGAVARIQYTGKVAPRVTFAATPLAFAATPFATAFYGPLAPPEASPFVSLDRISAQMDADMNALMQQADSLAMPVVMPDQVLSLNLAIAPRGATQYAFESMAMGNGDYCTRSMQVTSRGAGESPKVVSHSSGDCRAFGQATFGAEPHGWRGHGHNDTTEVNARPRRTFAQPGLVEAAYHPVN